MSHPRRRGVWLGLSYLIGYAPVAPVIVRRTRTVSVPIDVIWALIEPAESIPAWLPLGEQCARLSGEGLGRRQRLMARWGRKTVAIDQEVITYEPERAIGWRHLDERMDGKPAPRISTDVTVTIRLEPTHPGTRITLESCNVPSGLVAAWLLRLVAARRIGRAFDRALGTLAAMGG